MREIRQSGSEGGAGQTNVSSLPLSDFFSSCAFLTDTGAVFVYGILIDWTWGRT